MSEPLAFVEVIRRRQNIKYWGRLYKKVIKVNND